MEYNDSNMIKPVEGLDNITGISASRDGQGKKRRQQLPRQSRSVQQKQNGESNVPKEAESDNKGIDYIA